MSSVTIKRNVILRSIVTESLRDELTAQLQGAADELDQRLSQIDFQTKAYITDLQRTNLQQAMTVRKQIEAEKARIQEQRDMLLERKAQVQELEDGTDIVRGTLESFVDVTVGDNIAKVLGGIEIVTKDDEVVEIREREILDTPEESVAQIIHEATSDPSSQ